MSTGGISGSDQPGPSFEPEKKGEREPKVERSSIRPSEINDPEVGQMVQSVAGQKRQHSPEKNISSELPGKKKMKSTHKELLTLVEKCFGKKVENVGGLEGIAKQCFAFAAERLASFERLTWGEILKIYNLLYESALEPFSLEAASAELDLINPHPAYVFKSLYDSIFPLYQYKSFSEVVEMREKYISNFPTVKALLDSDARKRNEALCQLAIIKPEIVEEFNGCPIFTTRDLFESKNNHPAFVFRGVAFSR